MTVAMPEARFVHALFCDDIRLEIGNKVTLVGVYGSEMFLQELPAFIPKLGVAVYLVTPLEDSAAGLPVTLRVTKGDEVILVAEVESLEPVVVHPTIDGHDPATRCTYAWHFPLPPMTVLSPCTLRVTLKMGDNEFVGGKLRIGTMRSASEGKLVPAEGTATFPVDPAASQ